MFKKQITSIVYTIPDDFQFLKWKISILSLAKFNKVKNIRIYVIVENSEIEEKVKKIFSIFKLKFKLKTFNIGSIFNMNDGNLILDFFLDNGMIRWLLSPYIFDGGGDSFIISDNDTVYFTDMIDLSRKVSEFNDSKYIFSGRKIGSHHWVSKNSEHFYRNGYYEEIKGNLMSTSVSIFNIKKFKEIFTSKAFNYLSDSWFKNVKTTTSKWYSDEAFVNTLFNKWVDTSFPPNYNLTFQIFPNHLNKNNFIFHYFFIFEYRNIGLNSNSILLSEEEVYNELLTKIKNILKTNYPQRYAEFFEFFKSVTDFSRKLKSVSSLAEFEEIKINF